MTMCVHRGITNIKSAHLFILHAFLHVFMHIKLDKINTFFLYLYCKRVTIAARSLEKTSELEFELMWKHFRVIK